jgi:hypothetical protein
MRKGIVTIVVASMGLLLAFGAGSTRATSGWDYVYGDAGPSDYSKFQAVRLRPAGGAYLAGFFSGNFEGYSSPAAYRRFVQFRGPDGSVAWTKLIGNPMTTLPAPTQLQVDQNGVVLARLCSSFAAAGGSDCREEATFDSNGVQLGQRTYSGCGDGTGPAVAVQAGFVRVVGCGVPISQLRLEGFDERFNTLWTNNLSAIWTAQSAHKFVLVSAGDGGVWAAADVPRPLPTQRDALALAKFDASGALERTILHYGYTLGFPAADTGPAPQSSAFVTANRDFVWLNVFSSTGSYRAGYISTVAFRTDNGELIGPAYGEACSQPPDLTKICGGYGTKYILLRPGEVVRGGQRAIRQYSTIQLPLGQVTGTYLGIYDLQGVTDLQPKLVKSIPLGNGVTDFVVDADEDGDIVVAGGTTGSVVFLSAGIVNGIRVQDTSSPRAFVSRNPGGRVPLKLVPHVPFEVKVTGVNGIPETGVSAVSMNVTVTEAEGDGFITVYPCGERKVVSSLNYVAGQTVPNAVIAPVSPAGTVCFFAMKPTHLLADVNGWFASSSGYTALDPTRVFDTRPGQPAAIDVPRVKVGGPGNILEVPVVGIGGVPSSGVSAVSLNVTVTEPDGGGFVTVYPCGERKVVSSLNYVAGQTVPNAVIAPVSSRGTVCLYSQSNTHLLADVNGWFASSSGYTALDPTRVFDTR